MRLLSNLCLIYCFFLLIQCAGSKSTNTDLPMTTTPNYEELWKKVQKYEEDGLPKSALEVVDSIYAISTSGHNAVQQIKSLVYRAKYTAALDEEGVVTSIALFEKELKVTDDRIAKAIMRSLLAELYSNYFNMNIWQIKDRTETNGVDVGTVENWSRTDFLKVIRKNYLASVQEPLLKSALVRDYMPLLTDAKNSDSLRPYLYDILAHRAVTYFQTGRADLDLNDQDALINDPLLFAHTDQFVHARIQDADTATFYGMVIDLFKSLESFHRKDVNPAAWTDVVKERLQYVYNHFQGENKNALYEAVLDQWIKSLSLSTLAAGFELNKAILYSTLGRQYQANSPDSVYRQHLVRSVDLLKSIIAKYKNTSEASQAENLLNDLTRPSLNAQAEKVNLINQSFRILVDYQNTSSAFIKVIPVTLNMRQEIYSLPAEQFMSKLMNEKPVFSLEQNIPASEDLQHHAVEIKIDGLPAGMYAILLSNDHRMRQGDDIISVLYTHVSNLAYIHSFNQYYSRNAQLSSKNELVVMHRESGVPLAGVKFSFYENQYQPTLQRNHWVMQANATSDINGKVNADLPKNKNYSVKLEQGNDYLWLDDAFSNSTYYEPNQKDIEDVLFFLDRSIYRPGQTIFFKGLALLRQDNGKVRILKNKKIEVALNDANGQQVIRKSFVSNDFGSINGSFVAPVTGLTGSMTLVSSLNQSNVSFQVEEYKRPKFEVKFDTTLVTSNLNEAITVTGFAKNLAGNSVDHAQVKYKVSRQRWIRPMPWWFWRDYYPMPSNPVIISQGTLLTDKTGKFNIPFTALAEVGANLKKDDLNYIFTIDADVTDFTGETRSANSSLRIGNKNLVLSSSLNQYEIKDSLKSFKISGEDLNGQSLHVNGNYTVSRLAPPSRMPRSRYWNRPDQHIYGEKTYHSWFPLDIYADEDQITTWPVSNIVMNGSFDSQNEIKVVQALTPGIYRLEINSKDSHQQNIKYEQYFWIEDPAKGAFATIKPLAVFQNKSLVEPNEPMAYILGARTNPQYILQSTSSSSESQWINAGGPINNTITLKENDRGVMNQLHWYMIRDNRIYTESLQYGIPWSDKELTIETITFRDKLLPGQNEEWKLKISGKGKDKLVSELVADMYDQSLDALYPHSWNRDLYRMDYLSALSYIGVGFAVNGSNMVSFHNSPYKEVEGIQYRDLNWFGFEMAQGGFYDRRGGGVMMKSMRTGVPNVVADAEDAEKMPAPASPPQQKAEAQSKTSQDGTETKPAGPPFQPRKNLKETVFFFPEIKSDAEGNFILKFKMNEALTRWRLMIFGHSQDLKSGYLEKEIVTQKDLMVFPNSPRFVRQGDLLEFPAKVANLSGKTIQGTARLDLFDPMTNKSLDKDFTLKSTQSAFNIPQGESAPLSWTLTVPDGYTGLLGYRVIAETGAVSDGEENILPVLSNRMLVTETYPFQVRAKQDKTFDFTAMVSKMHSTSLKNHQYTLECTSNPAWYAIQSLPYMMEFPYECTEQLINRYYANALAAKVVESNPKIKTIFEAWSRNGDLKSPLQKNQELKTAVLEETPWVRDALNEAEQQKMIALLFDINKLSSEKAHIIQVLKERQLSNGGFSWFAGRDDWYITQYIVEALGHLRKLGIEDDALNEILANAVTYCDRELVKWYNEMKKVAKKDEIGLPDIALHYLYARSFFPVIEIEDKSAFDYFVVEAEKQWLKQNLYNQGLVALAVHRWRPNSIIPSKILASLNEKAQHSEELGMYWKIDNGYRFFELPVETQSLIIEAFTEMKGDPNAINEMRLWLLKNKQTNHWPSTKSTAAAIYALMLNGDDWTNTNLPVITLANEKINIPADQTIAGLGYFKIKKEAATINASLAHLTVNNPNNHVLWGAAYWQYFEDMDKISASTSKPFVIKKSLFVESTDGNKTTLNPFTVLHVGDKVVVRLEIKVDRPMEYIHLKDMRASGLEPINVISQYKYQGGLGYYESTKDLATNFFFDHIITGTYVLEYPVRVAQRGTFSNGITTMQCMYAPEFSGHTSGEVVKVK